MATLRACIVGALLLVARSGRADQLLAQQHDRMARAETIAGHLGEAILHFELAFRADPNPKYLYNKAVLELRLATAGSVPRLRSALADFNRYLAAAPNAEDRRQVQLQIVELTAKIQAADATGRDPSVGDDDSPGFVEPPAAATVVPPRDTAAQPPPSHKRAWIAIGVGSGVLVAGGIVALSIVLTNRPDIPASNLGNMEAHFK